MLQFWNNVKDELDYYGKTQKELAKNIGVSYNTLQSWINRDRLPNAEQAVKIATSLHCTVEFLVTGKKPHGIHEHSKVIKSLEQIIEELIKMDE